MKFKIDENLPQESAQLLSLAGYDTQTVKEQNLVGVSDATLYNQCQSEGRILITLDLGYANILAYPPRESPGIIILRANRQDKETVINLLKRIITHFGREPLTNRLWVVDENQLRVRGG
ncbi:MAG: DUF5615 family PIN-like protein [candidate division WOR-3 bacterium]